MSTHNESTVKYFAEKAAKYDDVDSQAYWVFSDSFYKEVLRRELGAFFANRPKVHLLDAGAGTGRWSFILNEIFGASTEITGKLVDISPEMLNVAKDKLKKCGLEEKFETSVCDIENLSLISEDTFDLSISFYNVVSFVENPTKALSEINRTLKPGGIHLSVVANLYHSLYFATLTGRLGEIDRVTNESKIAFNDLMPPIHCFTPDSLQKTYLEAGFSSVNIFGGPNFIYPGMEETFISGNTASIENFFATEHSFQTLLDTELALYRNPDVVGRGNTLLGIGTK